MLKSKSTRKTMVRLLATACALGLTVTATTTSNAASAQEIERTNFIEDVGGSARINLSGKLRMLSQRIPAAACYYAAGVETEATGAMLEAAANEFQKIIEALEYGDDSLGVYGPESRRKTLVGLSTLHEAWDPMLETARHIQTTGGTNDDVMHIADQSAEVLRIAKLLVSQISGQYADPTALLHADAMLIDIAGRQRMLSQRMSKNTCLVASGVNADAAMLELAGAAEMFNTSLDALQFGMVTAGINPPPNAQIEDGLEVVRQDWTGLDPIVKDAATGASVTGEALATMFHGANAMTGNMNTVVGMYSEASKLGL